MAEHAIGIDFADGRIECDCGASMGWPTAGASIEEVQWIADEHLARVEIWERIAPLVHACQGVAKRDLEQPYQELPPVNDLADSLAWVVREVLRMDPVAGIIEQVAQLSESGDVGRSLEDVVGAFERYGWNGRTHG